MGRVGLVRSGHSVHLSDSTASHFYKPGRSPQVSICGDELLDRLLARCDKSHDVRPELSDLALLKVRDVRVVACLPRFK